MLWGFNFISAPQKEYFYKRCMNMSQKKQKKRKNETNKENVHNGKITLGKCRVENVRK